MMGGERRLSLKLRLGVAALAVTMLVSAGAGGLVAIQSAQGITPVEALLGRAIFRTISHKKEEKADRSAINQRRDAEKSDVDQEQEVLDFKRDRGWIDQETYEQESARLVALKNGMDERSKRERQIVSFQTRRNIRGEWAGTALDVITVSTGVDPRAVRFTESLLKGEKPITAALDAVLSGGREVVDPRQQFLDLRDTLIDVKEGLRFVRGNAGLLARAELTRLLRDLGGPDVTSEEAKAALERARQLGEDVEKAVEQAEAIKADLFPRSSGIDRSRFATNERWILLNDNVQALSESTAGRAVLSGLLRKGIERARELLEGTGITLTDEQLIQIARDAGSMYVAARVREGEVLDASEVDIDGIVRAAVNQALATAGLDPLGTAAAGVTPTPTREPTPTPTPEPTPSPAQLTGFYAVQLMSDGNHTLAIRTVEAVESGELHNCDFLHGGLCGEDDPPADLRIVGGPFETSDEAAEFLCARMTNIHPPPLAAGLVADFEGETVSTEVGCPDQ